MQPEAPPPRPSISFQGRIGLKAAGRAFGREAANAISRAILDCPTERRTSEYVDSLTARALQAIEQTAAGYRDANIPADWIGRFRSAATRTLRNEIDAMARAAQAAGRLN